MKSLSRGLLPSFKNWHKDSTKIWNYGSLFSPTHITSLQKNFAWQHRGQKISTSEVAKLKLPANKTSQKATKCVWFELWKLGKWMFEDLEIGASIHCHEENILLWFGLMKNHRTSLMSVQSWLPRTARQGTSLKSVFSKWNDPCKVWRRIR